MSRRNWTPAAPAAWRSAAPVAGVSDMANLTYAEGCWAWATRRARSGTMEMF